MNNPLSWKLLYTFFAGKICIQKHVASNVYIKRQAFQESGKECIHKTPGVSGGN